MTYTQLIEAIKERGFSFEKEKIEPENKKVWILHSFQLPYITGVKAEGIEFFSYNHLSEPEHVSILIPYSTLLDTDITFLTIKRKHNLWTDVYTSNYSRMEKYKLADLTKEQLFELFDKQEKLYKVINGLHKNDKMKGIIEQINTLRKEIRDKKTGIDNLNKKLADWYSHIYQIEQDN